MHKDPGRDKYQVLPFGSLVVFQNWPEWVTVKSTKLPVNLYRNKYKFARNYSGENFMVKKTTLLNISCISSFGYACLYESFYYD